MSPGTAADRRIGMWSGLAVVGLGVIYVITGAVGTVFGANRLAFAVGGHGADRGVRLAFLATAVLCLTGTIAPASGDLRFQIIAIAGYAFVFPVACLASALWFRRGLNV